MKGVHIIFDIRLVKTFKHKRNGTELVIEAEISATRWILEHIILVNYWHSSERCLDELLIRWRILNKDDLMMMLEYKLPPFCNFRDRDKDFTMFGVSDLLNAFGIMDLLDVLRRNPL